MIGLVTAAAILLLAAGLGKIRRLRPSRSALRAARIPLADRVPDRLTHPATALVEIGLGAAAVLVGGRLAGLLVAVPFAVLTVISARLVALAPGQDCGCFATASPMTHWHTAVNGCCTVAGLAALLLPARSLPAEFGEHPVVATAILLASVLLAYLGYLTMTALPDLLAATAELEATG